MVNGFGSMWAIEDRRSATPVHAMYVNLPYFALGYLIAALESLRVCVVRVVNDNRQVATRHQKGEDNVRSYVSESTGDKDILYDN